MIAAILAVSITFTATATGVEKGTPVEFIFAGRDTDRDYESMFLVDGSVKELCDRLEKAGVPRGRPVDADRCRLWPVGCRISFEPSLGGFVDVKMPEGLAAADPIYTGGTRKQDGSCEADKDMPSSVFSAYSLSQSPIVYNGIFDQGAVYGSFTAGRKLKRGERIAFTVTADPATFPRTLHLTVRPGNSVEVLKTLREESEKGEVDALIGFDETLTISEATAVANALATIDSPRVKINGCTNIFYRSFLPLVKWRDRKERLVQPFELTIGEPDKLVFIEEDWSVEGNDPKLTPRQITFDEAAQKDRTDTCFVFASPDTRLSKVLSSMANLKGAKVKNWYVFAGQ